MNNISILKSCFLFSLIAICSSVHSQKKFRIEFVVSKYINDSIYFSTQPVPQGFESFYNFEIVENEHIVNLKNRFKLQVPAYYMAVKEKNSFEGIFTHPIPVAFSYYHKETHSVSSYSFFLDSGLMKIELPQESRSIDLVVNSPINRERNNFQKRMMDLYVKTQEGFDSLINFSEKHKRIGNYIVKYPNSYVAFWEIINDYALYHYDPVFLKNLLLFSPEFKRNTLYKQFKEKLEEERSFILKQPKGSTKLISVEGEETTLEKELKNLRGAVIYIDFWASWCGPCRHYMKYIPSLKEEFKNYNFKVLFISTDMYKENWKNALKQEKLNDSLNFNIPFFDNTQFAKQHKINSLPRYMIIGKSGKIVEPNAPFPDDPKLKTLFFTYLNE
jgi:thiol-disulfide isomerase/thioredoxin